MATKSNSGRRYIASHCETHGDMVPIPQIGDRFPEQTSQDSRIEKNYPSKFSRIREIILSQFPKVMSDDPKEWLIVADQLENLGNVHMGNVLRLEAEIAIYQDQGVSNGFTG